MPGDGRRPKANANLQELSGGYFGRVVGNHERRINHPQPSGGPLPPPPGVTPPPPPLQTPRPPLATPPPILPPPPAAPRIREARSQQSSAVRARPHASSSSSVSSARGARNVARPSPPSSASNSFNCGSCPQTFKDKVGLRIHRDEWHGVSFSFTPSGRRGRLCAASDVKLLALNSLSDRT